MTTRPVEQLQRAHDLLVGILLKEVPNPGFDEKYIHAAADVLCWALNHDHNIAFDQNLKRLEGALAERGFFLCDHGN